MIKERMAEWLKAADCKFVGIFLRRFESCSSQSALHLVVRMLPFQGDYEGSNPSGHEIKVVYGGAYLAKW